MKGLSRAAQHIEGQPMFKMLDKIRKLEEAGRKILHFEIGDSHFDTPANIIQAAHGAMQAGETHYTSSYGLPDFREVIRAATRRSRGFTPDVEQVLVTPGANIAIFYAIFCLVNPGEEVIVPDPGFPTYYSAIKMLGAKAIHVPLREENNFRMQPGDVAAAVTGDTRLIIINSPHNPTGAMMTAEEIQGIYEVAERNDIYLVSDEIYARMTYDAAFHSPAVHDHCRDRTIITNGFSKAFAMTGWRLGAVIGPATVMERMQLLLQTTSSCVSPFIQRAGIEAIEGAQEDIAAMIHSYRVQRDLLVAGINRIPGLSCQPPPGAFYLFVNITGTGMDSETCADFLLDKAGVAVLPGTNFGIQGEGFIRLCYAPDVETISQALIRIEAALKERAA